MMSVSVVEENVSLTVPTVKTVSTVVSNDADEMCLTVTVDPELIGPGVVTKGPPSIEYSPPVTDMEVGMLIPVIVTALDVCCVDNGTSVTSVNAKASGMVSTTKVVELKVSDTPPMVTVVSTVVAEPPEEVC